MSYLALSYTDIAIAATFLLVQAALTFALNLGLGRSLIVAAVRMVGQLLLLGLVLHALFETRSLAWTALAVAVMVGFAGYEALARQTRRLTGGWSYAIAAVAMALAALSVVVIALIGIVRPTPWYDPRFAVPLVGMVLGNTMTGVALGLHSLANNAVRDRLAIEARLTLGAPRWTALNATLRDAMRAGLIPIVNAMAATGLVAIPGMMTGQILAGAPPTEAIKYQLLVMFMIAGGTGIGVFVAVYWAAWRLTDPRHRLRLDRLSEERAR